MTADQFRTLLDQLFHGSIHSMQVWAKKMVNRHREKRPVNPVELQTARAALAYLDSKGLV